MNLISFITANYVAREVGYAMHGWGHGDRATNDAFRPPETFAQRFGELLGDIRALGFDAIDLWGAHLNPAWASDEQVAIARELLTRHGLRVATYEVFVGPEDVERACDIAETVGTSIIAGFAPAVPRGFRRAVENHDEKTPAELLARTDDGVCVDTGWWGTQGYDPVRAIEELGDRILHVHLKDVLAPGAHDTCRWGLGCVDVEGCVRALQRLGYAGALSVEHEPEDEDPSEDCRAMRAMLEGWLAV